MGHFNQADGPPNERRGHNMSSAIDRSFYVGITAAEQEAEDIRQYLRNLAHRDGDSMDISNVEDLKWVTAKLVEINKYILQTN